MGFITMLLMIVGWVLVIFAAFGSGLTLHIGNLSTIETAFSMILLALCIGPAYTFAGPMMHRPAQAPRQ